MDQNPPEILKVQPEAFLPERGRERIWRHVPFSILFGSILLTNISYNALKDPQNFQPPAALAQASEVQPSPKQLIIEKPEEKKLKFEEIIFKNFSAKEKALAETEIAGQIKKYKDQTGHEKKAKRVLDLEKTAIKPILDLDVPPEDHQFWSEFMSAIAYIESGGKEDAVSEVGIVGVAQISQPTAKATAKRHGILTFDLKNGWDSLRLSRFHFQNLMERYSPDISLLGYFAGEPFTDKKVLNSLETKINVFNLGSEDGKEYFVKTVAAHRILEEARNELNPPETKG